MAVRAFLHRLFYANTRRDSIGEITAEELRVMGITTVALDADNTSSFDRTTNPLPGTSQWVEGIKNAGFKVVLVSNASTSRAKHLADCYEIPVVGMALKPLPFGYIRTAIKLHEKPSNICMIGDQLFTDILGANLVGFKSIYVYPYQKETRNKISFAIRRYFERIIFSYQDKKYN